MLHPVVVVADLRDLGAGVEAERPGEPLDQLLTLDLRPVAEVWQEHLPGDVHLLERLVDAIDGALRRRALVCLGVPLSGWRRHEVAVEPRGQLLTFVRPGAFEQCSRIDGAAGLVIGGELLDQSVDLTHRRPPHPPPLTAPHRRRP